MGLSNDSLIRHKASPKTLDGVRRIVDCDLSLVGEADEAITILFGAEIASSQTTLLATTVLVVNRDAQKIRRVPFARAAWNGASHSK